MCHKELWQCCVVVAWDPMGLARRLCDGDRQTGAQPLSHLAAVPYTGRSLKY